MIHYYCIPGIKEKFKTSFCAKAREQRTSTIIEVCSKHFGIDKDELFKENRSYSVKVARFIAMHIMYHRLKFTYKGIGDFFNGRDHSTVIHAVRTVDTYLDERFNYDERFDYEQIIKLI